MRWFTGFAILVYLALLSSPQALAVYGNGLERLADTQLQGLNPAISSALHQQAIAADNSDDDEPPAAIIPDNQFPLQLAGSAAEISRQWFAVAALSQSYAARAPPAFISL